MGLKSKKFKAYGIDCTGILGFRVLKFGVLRLLGVRNLECGIWFLWFLSLNLINWVHGSGNFLITHHVVNMKIFFLFVCLYESFLPFYMFIWKFDEVNFFAFAVIESTCYAGIQVVELNSTVVAYWKKLRVPIHLMCENNLICTPFSHVTDTCDATAWAQYSWDKVWGWWQPWWCLHEGKKMWWCKTIRHVNYLHL